MVWTAGLYGFSFFSGGYGTGEMVKGVIRVFFLCFLQFAVSSLGGWISSVGTFV